MRKSADVANAQANERRTSLNIRVADLVSVLAFHADKMTVDVKPLVKRGIISGVYVSPPPILAVKVARIPLVVTVDGEEAAVVPDIKTGDIGVVVYLDLDSDNAVMTGTESQPNSSRIHSGDDAVFIGVITPG